MMKRNDYLLNKFFAAFLPVCIIAVMAFSITNVVDSFVASNVIGGNALAAVEITGPVIALLAVVSGILGGGALTLCTYYIGEGKEERIAPVFTLTMLIGAFFGLVMTVLAIVMPETLAAMMGADEELLSEAARYITGISLGCIPVVMSFMLMNFVRMDGSESLPMIATGISTLVNIVLDFVLAGPCGLGVLGLALATSISNVVSVIVNLTHFRKKGRVLRLAPFWTKDTARDLAKTLNYGAPEALNTFSQVVKAIYLNFVLVGLGGAAAMNVFAIRSTVNSILCAVPQGIASALNFNLGVYFGEKDDGAIRATMKGAIRIGLIICAAMLAVILVLAGPIVGMFGTGTPEAVVAIEFLGAALLFQCITEILTRHFQSIHNIKLANYIAVMHQVGFLVIFVQLLTPSMGLIGVWIAMILAEIFTVLSVVIIAAIRVRRRPSMNDMLMLPKEICGSTLMDFSVENTREETEKARAEIGEKLGAAPAEAFAVIADNLLAHGYEKGRHWFDVRISRDENGLKISVRDDGREFDPSKWLAEHPEGDSGLHRLNRMAAKLEYHYTMRTNNFFVTLK